MVLVIARRHLRLTDEAIQVFGSLRLGYLIWPLPVP